MTEPSLSRACCSGPDPLPLPYIREILGSQQHLKQKFNIPHSRTWSVPLTDFNWLQPPTADRPRQEVDISSVAVSRARAIYHREHMLYQLSHGTGSYSHKSLFLKIHSRFWCLSMYRPIGRIAFSPERTWNMRLCAGRTIGRRLGNISQTFTTAAGWSDFPSCWAASWEKAG